MANKKISELTPKGATIAADDLIEVSEYVSPGVYTSKYVTGAELPSGATVFTGLTDTPASYTGESLKVVRVNAGETALEFATISGADTNISTTDLTFTANRAHNVAGFNLNFENSYTTFKGATDNASSGFLIKNLSGSNLFDVRNTGECIFRQTGTVDMYYYNTTNLYAKLGRTTGQGLLTLYAADGVTEVVRAGGGQGLIVQSPSASEGFYLKKGGLWTAFIWNTSANGGNLILLDGTGVTRKVNLGAEGGIQDYINTGFNFGVGTTTPSEKLHVNGNVRADGVFNANGSAGLSNTYTFGGGASGEVATMTFTGGILTAVTLVP